MISSAFLPLHGAWVFHWIVDSHQVDRENHARMYGQRNLQTKFRREKRYSTPSLASRSHVRTESAGMDSFFLKFPHDFPAWIVGARNPRCDCSTERRTFLDEYEARDDRGQNWETTCRQRSLPPINPREVNLSWSPRKVGDEERDGGFRIATTQNSIFSLLLCVILPYCLSCRRLVSVICRVSRRYIKNMICHFHGQNLRKSTALRFSKRKM